jgi:rRNA processing protein Gar1
MVKLIDKAMVKYTHLSKVFGNVKNPYIINQNHIFSKIYYEVISG